MAATRATPTVLQRHDDGRGQHQEQPRTQAVGVQPQGPAQDGVERHHQQLLVQEQHHARSTTTRQAAGDPQVGGGDAQHVAEEHVGQVDRVASAWC